MLFTKKIFKAKLLQNNFKFAFVAKYDELSLRLFEGFCWNGQDFQL